LEHYATSTEHNIDSDFVNISTMTNASGSTLASASENSPPDFEAFNFYSSN
jgi:hypothetical protein